MPSLREAGAVSSRALQPWCGFRLSHRRMGSRRRSTFVRFAGDQIRGEQITACRASRACHLFPIKRVLLARSHSLGLLILCGCFALSRQSGGRKHALYGLRSQQHGRSALHRKRFPGGLVLSTTQRTLLL